MGSHLDVDHASHSCSKKKFSINLIDAVDDSSSTSDSELFYITNPGDNFTNMIGNRIHESNLQNEDGNSQLLSTESCRTYRIHDYNRNIPKLNNTSDISDSSEIKTKTSENPPYQERQEENRHNSGIIATKINTEYDDFITANLRKIQTSTFPWNTVQKSCSPKIKCKLKETIFCSLIDCGAEINVIDKDFACSVNIGISNTKEVAHAANKLPLDVVGQTMVPVSIQCFTIWVLSPYTLV